MPPVSPADGPVAVTGASGFIGSWIVRDLAEQGYSVRACVRDPKQPGKVDHLLALNNQGFRGHVDLARGDLAEPGSYDDAFHGCCAVIHTGAAVGYNGETPQKVYDGCFTEVQHVLESVKQASTVKRFVFTSSFAAAAKPAPEGYVFTERDWVPHEPNVNAYKGRWTEAHIPKNRDIAYAIAKARGEKLAYSTAEAAGNFEAMAILPLHVIGPVMGKNHDQRFSWQNCVRAMMNGKPYIKTPEGRMLWNNVDVRDTARAHRLCIESTTAKNGSRYILAARDRRGELFTWEMQKKLQELYPFIPVIGGEVMDGDKPKSKTYDSPRSYCLLAMQELGLEPFPIEQTLRDMVDSYFRLGLIKLGHGAAQSKL